MVLATAWAEPLAAPALRSAPWHVGLRPVQSAKQLRNIRIRDSKPGGENHGSQTEWHMLAMEASADRHQTGLVVATISLIVQEVGL